MDSQVSSSSHILARGKAEAHLLAGVLGIHSYQGACNLDKASTAAPGAVLLDQA